MNVHGLRCSANSSAPQHVLPVVPLVRCQAHSNSWGPTHIANSVPRAQESGSREMGCPWPCRDATSQHCPRCVASQPIGLRFPEQDESPLSQSEAAIAMRFFPIQVST